LLGVPGASLAAFLGRAREIDQATWVIGRVEAGAGIKVSS
jgi:hypothetical protein